MARTHVFISYSHDDKNWLEELQKHLKHMEREGRLIYWDDTKIKPGTNWRSEIEPVGWGERCEPQQQQRWAGGSCWGALCLPLRLPQPTRLGGLSDSYAISQLESRSYHGNDS